ncbi:MAG: sorbosone dehydrogenase family protein [Chitinophagaceae bacterium]|nr:MAG: sorbosone dehydrogenase family protein [Chitinophagaceae bacterium]
MRTTIISNFFLPCFILSVTSCGSNDKKPQDQTGAATAVESAVGTDTLPAPFATKSVTKASKIVGWKDGLQPTAPAGFTVSRFADSLDHPRWIYQSPNGDVFVAEAGTVLSGVKKLGAKISKKAKAQKAGESADRITMFRDSNKDGIFDSRYVFAEDLNQPLGMLVLKDKFYIANTDGLRMYDYRDGMTSLADTGKQIVNLPAGGYNNHWTRNIIANADGTKIYVSVGSGSNVAEHGMENEIRRANILEINPDGTGERIYASGLRNPVGMDWAPGSNILWTAVNERDELGDDLVPDYMTSVKEGGFYGWPYAYFGNHPDPRMKDDPHPEMVSKAIVPDVPLGPHTASLGLAFYDKQVFPAKYRSGAFIGQHGSWNRSDISGYKVVFVPFAEGKPAGKPEDFLTGFIIDQEKAEVAGRPVGVTVTQLGDLLVADDVSNVIWRVSASK